MSAILCGEIRHFFRLEGDPRRPCLVLVHPVGFDHSIWDEVTRQLTAEYRVLRYDLRGHGATLAPPGEMSLAQFAADLSALTRALGIEHFGLCGISLGALTGVQMALSEPERVQWLVLANTSARLPLTAPEWDHRRKVALTDGLSTLLPGTMARMLSSAYREAASASMYTLQASFLATPAQGYADALCALRDADLRNSLSSLPVPTLVISSKDDLVTPAFHMELMAASIPGATYLTVPGGHLSPVEAPLELATAIKSFGASCEKRPHTYDPEGQL